MEEFDADADDDMGGTGRVGENLASSCDLLSGANGGGGLRLRLAGDEVGEGPEIREMFDAAGDGGGKDGAGKMPILPLPPTPVNKGRGDGGGDGSRVEDVAIQPGRPSAWTRRVAFAVVNAGCDRWTFSCLRGGLGVGGGTGGAPPVPRVSRSAVAVAMMLSPSRQALAAEVALGALQRGMGRHSK